MQRKFSRPLVLGLLTGFLAIPFGCSPASTGGGGDTGSGGNKGGSGGNHGTGGNGNNGTGGNGNNGTGGNGSGGNGTTGSGGNRGTGGNGTNGSGGNGTGSGGNGSGGNGTGSGGNGSGGNGTGSGGNGTTGSGGGTSTRACPPASADVISDFEEGMGVLVNQGTPVRNGWWYTYPNPVPSGTMLSPAPMPGPIAVAASGSSDMCNKYALHVTGSGFGTAPNNYVGFGASFLPDPAPATTKKAYDVSAYKGISFTLKSGSGTPAAVYVEMLTKESQPTTSGGNLNGATGSPDTTVGLYNTRGQMLVTPYIPSPLTTTSQTVYVPFGTLIPRWMPAAGASMACPAAGAGVPRCQAPKFVPADFLGIQLSLYRDPGFPSPSGSTAGTFDVWIDDVTLVKDDTGLPTRTGFPLASAGSVGSCTKPAGADGKFLVTAYNLWKSTFVQGGKVIRPENGNDTVSEGIAYGMLISVNMNDQTLFDQLYSYWKNNKATGGSPGLMTWCIPAGGGSCSASGGGSAIDADEDAAFALIQAGKLWGGTYNNDAKSLVADIWTNEIDKTSHLPTGGSNYSNSTSSKVTNPSYFAPAYYRAFMAAPVSDANAWGSVITAVYGVINGSLGGASGLFPAWCSGNCTAVASNGGANDMIYQYDSHRIPMRIGLDYCWNGATASAAQTYTNKTTNFFATSASAGLNGAGRILDLYNLNGNPASGAAPNSASIIGTAAVGAMASAGSSAANKQFLDDAYQLVFDEAMRATLAPVDSAGKTPYSYFNATVGMMTLLMMTGNFSH